MVRELEFLEPLEVSILSQRRSTEPYGCHGGGPGARGRNALRRRGTDEVRLLAPVDHIRVYPGDVLLIETPGGGGWGNAEACGMSKAEC